MPDADKAGRTLQDLREHLAWLEALQQLERGLVHGSEVEIPRRVVVGQSGVVRGLGQVQRAVGDRDEAVLVPRVLGEVRDADADRHPRPGRVREARHGRPDALGDLARPSLVGTWQQDRELVAAVSEEAVALAERLPHRAGDPAQERVAGGVAIGVVVGLEGVQVEHQEGERDAAPEELVQLALERAVVVEAGQGVVLGLGHDGAVGLGVAQGDGRLAGEQLHQLELVAREVGLVATHPRHVERADDLARHEERAHDHRLRLLRRARDLHRARVEVRVVGQDRLAVADRPAGDARVQRALVREDQVREPVAGDDRPPDPGVAVHAVDRQRVVGDHGLEGVRDHLEHAARVERGEEPLVHLEEAALALEAMTELLLLPADLAEGLGVDQRLRRVAREDLQDPLVVLGVLVVAHLGQDDDPQDRAPRTTSARGAWTRPRGSRPPGRPRPSAATSPSRIVALWSATHPVSPSPIRIRRRSNDGVPMSLNSPWNAMGSHIWDTWSTR